MSSGSAAGGGVISCVRRLVAVSTSLSVWALFPTRTSSTGKLNRAVACICISIRQAAPDPTIRDDDDSGKRKATETDHEQNTLDWQR